MTSCRRRPELRGPATACSARRTRRGCAPTSRWCGRPGPRLRSRDWYVGDGFSEPPKIDIELTLRVQRLVAQPDATHLLAVTPDQGPSIGGDPLFRAGPTIEQAFPRSMGAATSAFDVANGVQATGSIREDAFADSALDGRRVRIPSVGNIAATLVRLNNLGVSCCGPPVGLNGKHVVRPVLTAKRCCLLQARLGVSFDDRRCCRQQATFRCQTDQACLQELTTRCQDYAVSTRAGLRWRQFFVFFASVLDHVFVLDDTDLGEAISQPAVGGVRAGPASYSSGRSSRRGSVWNIWSSSSGMWSPCLTAAL